MTDQALTTPQQQPLAGIPEDNSILATISRLATNPDVDAQKFRELLDIQSELQAKYAERQFNIAMSEMQAELPRITKEGKIVVNGEVRSTYAKFEDINEIVKPIMKEHGFAISFRQDVKDKMVLVTGILMHRDGHREDTTLPLPADTSGSKNSVQSIGSSIKYGKRYVMCGLLNITEGEDDDGQAGGWTPEPITAGHLADLEEAIEGKVTANRPKTKIAAHLCKYFKVDSISNLPDVAFTDAMSLIKQIKAQ